LALVPCEIMASDLTIAFPLPRPSLGLQRSLFGYSGSRIGIENVSFNLSPGDRLGIIGRNGAGKSTLLRALAGIYSPTNGTLHIRGEVSSFLDLTLGFNSDASAIENTKTRLVLMGVHLRDYREAVAEILDFAELESEANLPIRMFSTGMVMRLAFAIATYKPGNILLMDEWLSVGDAGFQSRASARMSQIMGADSILVLASHSKDLLSATCNKFLLLENGRMSLYGAKEVLDTYFSS